MALDTKQYLDLTGLQAYDTQIKTWANSVNQLGYKTVRTDGDNIYFYVKANATAQDTADVTVPIGGTSIATKLNALAAIVPATYDTTTSKYSVDWTQAGGLSGDLVSVIEDIAGDLNDLTAYVGTLPVGTSATNVVDYIGALPIGSTSNNVVDYVDEKADFVEAAANSHTDIAIGALSGTAGIASVSDNVVTLKAGVDETSGSISNTEESDIVLEEVAITGAAEDVSIADAGSYFTATDVEGALAELAQSSAGGVASKTVYMTETAGSSSDPFGKRYSVYQGANGSSASPDPSEKLGDIDIPKDMVVEEGVVVDITFNDGHLYDGQTDVTEIIKGAGGTATAADAGKYIRLTIANAASDKIYIKATDLVDIYTGGTTAEATVSIDSSNEITVTINTISGSKIIYKTESSAGAGDGETVNQALARIDDVIDDIDADIQAAIEALDGTATATAATGSDDQFAVGVLKKVVEVDGELVEVQASGSESVLVDQAGAATAAYNAIGSIPTSSINALFA